MVLALVLGAICSVMACALAAYQIGMHLKYYNSPPFQRYIIRIIFMVPVYAVCSVTTLADPKNAVIVSTMRDCYGPSSVQLPLAACCTWAAPVRSRPEPRARSWSPAGC